MPAGFGGPADIPIKISYKKSLNQLFYKVFYEWAILRVTG
jgi:hypothetical protein